MPLSDGSICVISEPDDLSPLITFAIQSLCRQKDLYSFEACHYCGRYTLQKRTGKSTQRKNIYCSQSCNDSYIREYNKANIRFYRRYGTVDHHVYDAALKAMHRYKNNEEDSSIRTAMADHINHFTSAARRKRNAVKNGTLTQRQYNDWCVQQRIQFEQKFSKA